MRYANSRNFTRAVISIALLAVAAFALMANRNITPSSAAVAFNGAIFTSTSTGTTPNANIYDARCDVYLNGGPQNQNSAGLPPNETFYFQVTDPSGAALLSTDDAVCRQVSTDADGTISGYVHDAACGTADHQNGTPDSANGSTPVQLCPFDFTPNAGGEYKVWLILKSEATINGTDPRVLDFDHNGAKTDNFKVREQPPCDPNTDPECPNPQSAIGGEKYYDLNTDGSLTAGEVGIPGWRIDVTTASGTVTTYTDALGIWALVFPEGTAYTACEVIPGSTTYQQTGPLSGAVTGDGLATANVSRCWVGVVGAFDTSDLNFGNVCLGAGGGLTLGFWSNKNGQNLVTQTDINNLNALCLRDANGVDQNWVGSLATQKTALKNFLLGATATNMSNMLSAQLAAMYLNRAHGFVSGGALVFAGSNPSGCSVPVNANGFITIDALIADASAELCADADGKALSGDPERTCQEFKKNALDKANNNLNFVQGTPCAFNTPY